MYRQNFSIIAIFMVATVLQFTGQPVTAKQARPAVGAKNNNPANSPTAKQLYEQAQAIKLNSQQDAAQKVCEKALRAADREGDTDRATLLGILDRLSYIYGVTGREAESIKLQERMLPLEEKKYGAKSEAVALRLTSMAMMYDQKGDFPMAEKKYLESIAIADPKAPVLMAASINLARIYRYQNKKDEADKSFQRAIACDEARGSKFSQELSLQAYSKFLKDSGQFGKAAMIESKLVLLRAEAFFKGK